MIFSYVARCKFIIISRVRYLVLKLHLLYSSKRLDIISITLLGAVSFIITDFFLTNHGQTMIYFDAYQNFQNARSIAEGTGLTTSWGVTQAPFLVLLSLISRLFPDPVTALLPLRIIILCFTVQLVIFFYLLARKMFNVFFSVVGAVLALFLPLVMVYSGTLHSDIFATAMGFTSLYFSIKPKRMVHVALATTFIILTSARLDTLIEFMIPYFIGLIYYIQSKTHIKFLVLFAIVLIIFFIPFYFVIQNAGDLYSSNYFHHSIIEQVVTLVNFGTINNVLQSSVEITGEKILSIGGYDGLNKLYMSVIFIGIIFFVFNYKKTIYKILTTMKYQFSEASTTVIYLVIITSVSIITLAAFHTDINPANYKFHLTYTFLPGITPRYMIVMRLFSLFGFIYGLSLASTAYRVVTNLVTKNKIKLFYGKFLTKRQNDVIPTSLKGIIPESIMQTKYRMSTYVSYAFVLFVITLFLVGMWDSAIRFYDSQSVIIEALHEASQWISNHLGNDERVFLPNTVVFWSFEPNLKNRTFDYHGIWIHSGILDRITTTNEEVLKVHQNFKDFIHNGDNKIKYLVFQLSDPSFADMSGITEYDLSHGLACEKFDQKLKEVKHFDFVIQETNWSSRVVICEVNKING